MKSYYVELVDIGKSRLNEEEIDTDNLLDNEAIIKSEYSLISAGTELSRAFGLKKGFSYPVRPGYSMVGTIIDKGNKLDVNIGDRVFVNAPHSSLVRWKHEDRIQGPMILKLDDDIDSLHATIINLALVAIQGVNLSEIKIGNKVAIFGLGTIGLITALLYKKMGCIVIGLDPISQRCKLAKELGIDYVVDDLDQKEKIMALTDNEGTDISVDVTGLSKVIIDAIDCTRKYGQVLLLGSPRQDYECNVTELLSMIHMKNLKVIGAFNQSIPMNKVDGCNDNMMNNYRVVSDLIRNKDIDVSKIISNIVDPKDCEKAYYDLMYNKESNNCIVFDWHKYE